jgi:hypothetical protein
MIIGVPEMQFANGDVLSVFSVPRHQTRLSPFWLLKYLRRNSKDYVHGDMVGDTWNMLQCSKILRCRARRIYRKQYISHGQLQKLQQYMLYPRSYQY